MGRFLSIVDRDREHIADRQRPQRGGSNTAVIESPGAPAQPKAEPEAPPALGSSVSVSLEDVLAPYRRTPTDLFPRDQRLSLGEVPWLSTVKLSWGLEVALLNISSTGILFETTAKFAPGSVTEFQLCGPGTSIVVPARFVRSEIAGVDARSVRYRAAATFTKGLQFPTFLGPAGSGSTPQALADLLTHVLANLDHRGQRAHLRSRFEHGIRQLVSARSVKIHDMVVMPKDGNESIYFTVPSAFGTRAILQAAFEPGHELAEAEFRLLKSAATLAAVVLEFEKMP